MEEQKHNYNLSNLENIIDTEFSNIKLTSKIITNVNSAYSMKGKKDSRNILSGNLGFILVLIVIVIITTVSVIILKPGNNTSAIAIQSTRKVEVTSKPAPTDQIFFIDIPGPTPSAIEQKFSDLYKIDTTDTSNIMFINNETEMYKSISTLAGSEKIKDYNIIVDMLNQAQITKSDSESKSYKQSLNKPEYILYFSYLKNNNSLVICITDYYFYIGGDVYKTNISSEDIIELYNSLNYPEYDNTPGGVILEPYVTPMLQ